MLFRSLEADGCAVAEAEITYRTAPYPNRALHQAMIEAARRVGIAEGLLDAA